MPMTKRGFLTQRPGRLAAAGIGLLGVAVVPVLPGLLSAPAGASATPPVTGPGFTTVGVAVDRGAYATKSPSVVLDLVWPTGATSALVSNDSSFDAAGGTTQVAPATTVPWTLPDQVAKKPTSPSTTPTSPTVLTPAALAALSKTVYVQFQGNGISPLTVSAHIVLDETAPVLADAQVLPVAHLPKGRARVPYRLRVAATDQVSGIAEIQTSAGHSGGIVTTLAPKTRLGSRQLERVITATSVAPPRYARVESVAGTWSSWEPVTGQLSVVRTAHGGSFRVGPKGTSFTMRGFDYQPLTAVRVAGKIQYDNDTFAPGYYNAAQAARTLKQMAALHYNSVRVFVNVNEVGNPSGPGVDPGYVAKLAAFVTAAQQDGIRVLLVTGELPTSGGYLPKNNADFGRNNAYFLDEADIKGKERYLSDLITALRSDDAPLSDVVWELAGEQDWYNKSAPLSWKRGLVRTANGGTYNMASAPSRAAMENANLLNWMNVLSSEIHRMVPASLVGLGVYAPSINLKRPQWTVAPQVLFTSRAKNDFVDIHVYSNLGTQAEQIQSFGAGATTKAVIMGEFGAARSAFANPVAGARGLVQWQQQSCHTAGLAISGWLIWTWNSEAQLEYWTALADHGVIERTLAPIRRPNPCA